MYWKAAAALLKKIQVRVEEKKEMAWFYSMQ